MTQQTDIRALLMVDELQIELYWNTRLGRALTELIVALPQVIAELHTESRSAHALALNKYHFLRL